MHQKVSILHLVQDKTSAANFVDKLDSYQIRTKLYVARNVNKEITQKQTNYNKPTYKKFIKWRKLTKRVSTQPPPGHQ